ncbi:MAG: RasGEF domain-containing protein, partial [Gammaproteobacteria bacterium]
IRDIPDSQVKLKYQAWLLRAAPRLTSISESPDNFNLEELKEFKENLEKIGEFVRSAPEQIPLIAELRSRATNSSQTISQRSLIAVPGLPAEISLSRQILSILNDGSRDQVAHFIEHFISDYVLPRVNLFTLHKTQSIGAANELTGLLTEFSWMFANILRHPKAQDAIRSSTVLKSNLNDVLKQYQTAGAQLINDNPELIYLQHQQLQAFTRDPYFFNIAHTFEKPAKQSLGIIFALAEHPDNKGVKHYEILLQYDFKRPLTKNLVNKILDYAKTTYEAQILDGKHLQSDIIEMLIRRPEVIKMLDQDKKLSRKMLDVQNKLVISQGQHLVKLEHYLVSEFLPVEFRDGDMNNMRQGRALFAHVSELMTRVSHFVELSLLKETNKDVRLLRVAQWLELAEYCEANGALSMASAILSGFGSQVLSLLVPTTKLSTSNAINAMQQMAIGVGLPGIRQQDQSDRVLSFGGLTDSTLPRKLVIKMQQLYARISANDANFKAYRANFEKLYRNDRPISPVIAVLSQDVTFAIDGNKANPSVSVEFFRKFWETLLKVPRPELKKGEQQIIDNTAPGLHPLMAPTVKPDISSEERSRDEQYVTEFFEYISASSAESYSLTSLESALANNILGKLTSVSGEIKRDEKPLDKAYGLELDKLRDGILPKESKKDVAYIQTHIEAHSPIAKMAASIIKTSVEPQSSAVISQAHIEKGRRLFNLDTDIGRAQDIFNYILGKDIKLAAYY